MGQPIPIPTIPSGNDCPRCTPPIGARWAPGETPAVIFVKFWGIANCGKSHHPAPNDLIMSMTQLPGFPCIWRGEGDVWKPEYKADLIAPPNCQLRLADHDGWSFFTGTHRVCSPEYQQIANLQQTCILNYAGAGGAGCIWWNDDLLQLSTDFGFNPGADLRYEVFKPDAVYDIHKFCDIEQRTNIKIKKV